MENFHCESCQQVGQVIQHSVVTKGPQRGAVDIMGLCFCVSESY